MKERAVKKAEHRRIDAFELWCGRRLFFLFLKINLFIYFFSHLFLLVGG